MPDVHIDPDDNRPIFLTDGQTFFGPYEHGDPKIKRAERELRTRHRAPEVHVIRATTEEVARNAYATVQAALKSTSTPASPGRRKGRHRA